MSKYNFTFQYVIGRGGFGKVSIVLFSFNFTIAVTGMARRVPQDEDNLRDEGNVKGAHHIEAKCCISHE